MINTDVQCPVWVVSPLTLEDLKGCELGIPGAKQPINAALAVLLCRLWRQRKDQGTAMGWAGLVVGCLYE